MKKFITLAFAAIMVLALTGCGGSTTKQETTNVQVAPQSSNNDAKPSNYAKKTLVLYFSRSGNTRELATMIHKKVGGDIAEIKTVKPYPKDHKEATEQVKKELASGFKPELQPLTINIAQYDTVFIGSPCWFSHISTPVSSFLLQNDMSGKTLIPFMTHGGSGLGQIASHIRELCPKANVRDGFGVRGSDVKNAQKDVNNWLQKLGMI